MSNTDMRSENTTELRLTALEIKATYMEDLVEQLEQVIVRQQQQIDRLQRHAAQLGQPFTDGGLDVTRSLGDDVPPHF